MSSTPALDVQNAETEIYPLLTVARIDRLRPFAQLTSVEKARSYIVRVMSRSPWISRYRFAWRLRNKT
jgi:hypothetical protein